MVSDVRGLLTPALSFTVHHTLGKKPRLTSAESSFQHCWFILQIDHEEVVARGESPVFSHLPSCTRWCTRDGFCCGTTQDVQLWSLLVRKQSKFLKEIGPLFVSTLKARWTLRVLNCFFQMSCEGTRGDVYQRRCISQGHVIIITVTDWRDDELSGLFGKLKPRFHIETVEHIKKGHRSHTFWEIPLLVITTQRKQT